MDLISEAVSLQVNSTIHGPKNHRSILVLNTITTTR